MASHDCVLSTGRRKDAPQFVLQEIARFAVILVIVGEGLWFCTSLVLLSEMAQGYLTGDKGNRHRESG
jgi:hypothetical protein